MRYKAFVTLRSYPKESKTRQITFAEFADSDGMFVKREWAEEAVKSWLENAQVGDSGYVTDEQGLVFRTFVVAITVKPSRG
jgi:hypothetical protein